MDRVSGNNATSPAAPDGPPALGNLTRAQCDNLLARQTVGRLAFTLHDHVSIIPVNYVFDAGAIYGRTQPGGKLLQIVRNRRVAFEIDEQERLFSWRSVVVHGSLYLLDLESHPEQKAEFERALEALRRIFPATMTESDPVPFRSQIFRIQVSEISGRISALGGVRIPVLAPLTRDSAAAPASDALLLDAAAAAVKRAAPASSLINVDVLDNVVVITGTVETSEEKGAIEREILKLPGARALVQQLETLSPSQEQHAPAELARDALRELEGMESADRSALRIVVEHDWLRAEGFASSELIKHDALRRLRGIRGSRGVIDRITVRDPERAV